MSNYSSSNFDADANTSWSKTFTLVKDNSTVLDIGCSTGTFGAELIKKKHCTVDGIEIDDSDFLEAKKKLRNVYKLNIETDTLNLKAKYDVIFMGDVIEHLSRPVPALRKVRQLLQDDGELVFSLPNITHISVRLMLLEGKIEYGKTGLLDETHLHFYNSEEIYRVFNEAGFAVKKFDYTVNDMPFELATDKLKALGLTPDKKFSELLNSVNGAAYQFVGVAVKSKDSKKQTLPDVSPPNIVGAYIDDLKKDYEAVIAGLKQNMDKIAEDRDRVILDRDLIQAKYKHPVNYLLKSRLHRSAKRAEPRKRNK